MAHAPWRSLDERVAQLEATIAKLRAMNDELRAHLENAHEAEAILRRVQQAQSPLEPMRMPPPQPRKGRHKRRDRGLTYLNVVKVATIGVLAAGIVTGAVIPASSHVLNPSPAAAASSFSAMEQDHVDAAEAGLCRGGQLPLAGEWPGSDAAVAAGRSPFGVVAYGGDAARAIAGGRCDAWLRR